MLVRPPPVRRGLMLSRANLLRRPRLAPTHPSLHSPLPTSTCRLLVTRPEQTISSRGKTIPHIRAPAPQQQRPLATAVDDHNLYDDIPFDHVQTQTPPGLRSFDLRAFDPASPLLLRVPTEGPLPRMRMGLDGIPGGIDEMLSIFGAYLQLGKLDRAALILQRLGQSGTLPHGDLISLHNRYLRANIDGVFDRPDPEWAGSVHSWFEVQIRGAGIPQTPETIACMLKVSLLSSSGPPLEHLITRYLDMMPGDAMFQVLSEVDILSQQDFGTIATIYKPVSSLLESWEYPLEDEEPTEATSEATTTTTTTTGSCADVLPTPQKGVGLAMLRGVLSFFDKVDGKDVSKLPLADRREVQARLEADCVDAAIARWREEHQALMKIGRNTSLSTGTLNTYLYDWHGALEKRLKHEFAMFEESENRSPKRQEDMDRCVYAPYLAQSDPTRLAGLTILVILNDLATTSPDNGIPLSILINHLAKSIEKDIQQQQRVLSQKSARQRKVRQTQGDAADPSASEQTGSTGTEANIIEAPAYNTEGWPALIRTKVGIVLLSALIDCAKVQVVQEHPETKARVSETQPAMAHASVFRKGKRVGMLQPNKYLSDLLIREPRADFLARHLPMVVEPEPWAKFDKGGFLTCPVNLVRIKSGEQDQRIYAEAAMKRGDLDQVSKGLDILGRTAWRINRPVFDVLLEAWNSKQKIANIPELDPQIPLPEEPDAQGDPMKRREWLLALRLVENQKSALHSERCYMNLQLEIARAFKDQTFYFPHNVDFRGRAYPIPTYLNHMGADHVRGILLFAKGRELGENGVKWIKVQLANVFGYDKASLKEREKFATDHLPDIVDSVTNPLNGKRWWLKAEDPFQCLAACFELKAALESPDPTKFVSHLPIHQDGTCNGLQHYAALGGDSWGAAQVNLEPSDRPADVYTAVAELVKKSIAEDLKTDDVYARALEGKITRKVVKQTVMTNVYGVTYSGARAQVQKQLNLLYPTIHKDTGVPVSFLSSYVAKKTFKALSTMFSGAHDIQYWLGECAGRVCRSLTPEQLDRLVAETEEAPTEPPTSPQRKGSRKKLRRRDQIINSFRSTIVWTTPLRMPIVQPYRKYEHRIIKTSLQDLILQVPERSDPVNRRKQLQAFPPNFIHSMDASHMLLSALECDERGLTFAAVHDSFWTHAADIDVMNGILRDAFIRIHSEDVIGRLRSEFQARYKGSLYLTTVPADSPVGREIIANRPYGWSLQSELLEEWKRLKLLKSSDPKEVAKGQEMVTPGSLLEKMSVPQPSSTYDEMNEVGLGSISEVDGEDEPDATSPESLSDNWMDFRSSKPTMLAKFEADFKGLTTTGHKKKDSSKAPVLHVWLPLTFPEIPKKGDFDVARLKDSKYFFS
ncbi:DNA-dependent RNA polymerase [Whalleya microplaca]|nr:DNA-dependent RNA polymerase [Whalleya microplaca]